MKTGENMQYDNNIGIREIRPTEEMLISKAKSLKKHDKTYKFLECLGDVLKINPNNGQALAEIAIYLNEGQ